MLDQSTRTWVPTPLCAMGNSPSPLCLSFLIFQVRIPATAAISQGFRRNFPALRTGAGSEHVLALIRTPPVSVCKHDVQWTQTFFFPEEVADTESPHPDPQSLVVSCLLDWPLGSLG